MRHHDTGMPKMLFRRFAIVTASIALMGIAVAHMIESTQSRQNGFSVDERMNEWKAHDARRACQVNQQLCYLADSFQATS